MFTFNITQINDTKNTNIGSFLQTPFWCEFKARHGWSYRRFLISLTYNQLDFEQDNSDCKKNKTNNEKISKTFELAVLNRNFWKNKFSIAYIPLMPELPYECTPEEIINKSLDLQNQEEKSIKEEIINTHIITPETQTIEFAHYLTDLANSLKKFLPKNTIAIRFDPNVTFYTPEDRDLFNFGLKNVIYADKLKLKKNKVDIQPPDSTQIDLTLPEDEILNKMHQKWRYNIRLAERKGVVIHKYLGNNINLSTKIDKFYELTKETNARDGNSSHAKSYYQDLIVSSANQISQNKDVPQISLYIAEHEGDEIASIMTLFSKDEAIYLYGASSNNKRNLMPNHLLQWTAMKDAKQYGSKLYDMYGMPPEGKNENHPMHGLYMFKANFGGQNIHRTGSWDIPTSFWYKPYNFVERTRAFWYKKVIKKLKHR